MAKYGLSHGMSQGSSLYKAWANMRDRCYNPNYHRYEKYGGRGISVCQDWRYSFEPFRDWALPNGWKKGLQLNRIDNDGNYCPDNCNWITLAEQQLNKTNTLRLSDGSSATVVAASNGIASHVVYNRLIRGWSIEKSVTEKVRPKVKGYKLPDGTLAWDLAKINGIPRPTFQSRLRHKWSPLDAATKPVQQKAA